MLMMPSMLACETQLVAIDFESTGVIAGYPDEPWQIGIVPISNGELAVSETFESYIQVDGERPFNPFAPGPWRLIRDEIEQAPSMDGLLPVLNDRIMNITLVAHNASTEKKIFRNAWPLHRPGPWIDTLKLSRIAFPELHNHKLGNVIYELGLEDRVEACVPGREAHDALYDAAASAVFLCYLLEQPGWINATVDDLIHAKPHR